MYDEEAYAYDNEEMERMLEYAGNSDLYESSFLSGRLMPPPSPSSRMHASGLRVGPVSAGEVQLQALQQELEAQGVAVEYKLGMAGAGAMLLCGGQVSGG